MTWLKNQKFVQADRIAVAGQSFGGIETVLGAEKYPFCAAVDASGGSMSWKVAPQLHDVMKKGSRVRFGLTTFLPLSKRTALAKRRALARPECNIDD